MTCLVVAGWRIVTLSSPSHVMTSNVVQPIQNTSQLTSVWLCARRGCVCAWAHVCVCVHTCPRACVCVCLCTYMCVDVSVCDCMCLCVAIQKTNQRGKISELKKLFVDHKKSV